jgi:hypothetical protein
MHFRYLALAALAVCTGSAAAASEIDFNRDIRPILSDKCFSCHGPDAEMRAADLRLDTREGLFADLGGYAPFVAGAVAESEALRRILAEDAFERMPPPDSNKTLSEAEMEQLQRWVKQGAPWREHWAFVAPRRPALPRVRDAAWPRNDIDYFVLSRLEEAGLRPSPEAEPLTLVRRLYLDLIGLPPTPQEADAWAARLGRAGVAMSGSGIHEQALEELVDHLFASPHYGERWARRWLDLARYADTNGYEKDRPRSIWAYRDWVVSALNQDMPFDQFTIEQIAGDMLPGATRDQHVATGFHRNTMLNEEGGIDPLEFRFYAMVDRVATTGTTWLGLTLGCAQCHAHKFDPISHHEYYELLAFLNNADEVDLDLPEQGVATRKRSERAEAKRLLASLPDKWPGDDPASRAQALEARFAEWLETQRAKIVPWTVLRPVQAVSNLPLLTVEDDDSVFASGDTTKQDLYKLTLRPEMRGITSLRLEALPDDRLPAHGPGMTYYEGTKGDFFLGEFRAWTDGRKIQFESASHSYAKNRFGANPVSAELAIDGDPQTGWSVDGRLGERHCAVFVLKEPLGEVQELKIEMAFGRHFASSLGRFRLSATTAEGGQAVDLPLEIEKLLGVTDAELDDPQRQRLRETFLLQAEEVAEHTREIRRLRQPPAYPTTLVMRERPPENPRPTFVHHRGEFLRPTDPVQPSTPQALHPYSQPAPPNRLGFARWLVSRDNPLTARVVVNRDWSAFFGTGLVRTLEDFGFQGESPSHPKLLDWLAVEFMEKGWSRKELQKQVVMSATYRQSSFHRDAQAVDRVDPANRLLSRANRFRLPAETIRDATLQAAGLLVPKMGGPPVRPPQPDGITEAAYGSPKWNPSEGEDRYRRSIYTYIKRTAPFAMFQTFDAPSGEACVGRRDVSNTALQALTLVNDITFIEAAQALGAVVAAEPAADAQRVRAAFRRVLTRQPEPAEVNRLLQFVQTQRKRVATGQIDAQIMSGLDSDRAAEAAVWTSLARALFALDEAITRN